MVELQSLSATGDVQNYVDGTWKRADSDDGQDVINPATGEELAFVPFSSESDIDDAVTSGLEAFEE